MSRSRVITIGNFDGVHLGHQLILAQARALAVGKGAAVKVLAFDPHPAAVLRPGTEPPPLCSLEERIALLKAHGADEVQVLAPTKDLLGHTAEEFVEQLIDEQQMVGMVEGEDFHFGQGRKGNVTLLRQLGPARGFDFEVAPGVEVVLSTQVEARVSSSLVRLLVGQGRVADAAVCLGRGYSLSGLVVRGEERGRQIGIPTANLDMAALEAALPPADGVYAGLTVLGDGRSFASAISVGVKPTFAVQQLTIEAHLLDFQGDLYGQKATMIFCQWLRDQQAFPNLNALLEQIGRDIARTRELSTRGELAGSGAQRSRKRAG